MTGEKYKIVSIYYSKPRVYSSPTGEPVAGRIGINITVGMACDYDGMAAKQVERIEYDTKLVAFKVYYRNKGMKVIPKLSDTEVVYELETNAKLSDKTK